MKNVLEVVMNVVKLLVKALFPKWLLRIIVEKYFEIKGKKNERGYQGNTVVCPCCGKSFSRFMDFKFLKGNNAGRFMETYKNKVCPYCFSMPRHRIICYYFDNEKKILPKNNIIIFGAEYSIKKWFDRNNHHYTTADLFNRTADVKADIQNTLFSDETWELIVCNHVLEHVPDYKKALMELKRIMRKDGILELTVPTDRNFETVYEDTSKTTKEERTRYFGQYDHFRIFGNDFGETLIELGFSVEIIDGDTLPSEIGGVIGPANYDDNRVYICRRK
jgi:predicted SAM-dependent methyltransferase